MITCSIDQESGLLDLLKQIGYTSENDIVEFSNAYLSLSEATSMKNLQELVENILIVYFGLCYNHWV